MLEVFFKKSDMNAFMFIDARGKLQVLFLKRSPPCFLRPGLSLATNLPSRVGWPTNMVWRASFPHFPVLGERAHATMSRLYWAFPGIELRSLS